MELKDAINLINHKNLQIPTKSVWADLGAGAGLFTHALATLLQQGSCIYAIDKLADGWKKHPNPGNILIEQRTLNFITDELNLANLDGILMANALHFVENKLALIHKLGKSLKANGSFLIVEYDTDTPNRWVPFPLSFYSLKEVFQKAGYEQVIKLAQRPSAFGRAFIYSTYISQ